MLNPLRFCRRHPWLSISVLTLLGAGAAFFFVLREGQINAANFERIEEGMTPAQLAILLGEPHAVIMHDDVHALADDVVVRDFYATARGIVYLAALRYPQPSVKVAYRVLCNDCTDRKRGKTQRWQDSDRAIVVVFDSNDRAVTASFETAEAAPSIWARVKNWFQNLW